MAMYLTRIDFGDGTPASVVKGVADAVNQSDIGLEADVGSTKYGDEHVLLSEC